MELMLLTHSPQVIFAEQFSSIGRTVHLPSPDISDGCLQKAGMWAEAMEQNYDTRTGVSPGPGSP